jgi:hypothetical protein
MVAITKSDNGFLCVQYADKSRGSIAGWVPSSRVVHLSHASYPTMQAWIGIWKMDENIIRIALDDSGALHLVGEATYQASTGPNYGSFDDRTRPVEGKVDLSSGNDPCAISMALVGHFLAVFDKGRCDGLNVSFTGLYLRQ